MTVADRVDAAVELDAFGRFCAELILEDGSRMVLEPFQRTMLADFFAGATETLVLLPKKNGKTSLVAAVALHHLLVTSEAECFVVASSRDQATILYNQAVDYVSRSPRFAEFLDVKKGTREIRSRRDNGRIRVLASDADTADGVIPTMAVVDELHRHKSADLYGVLRDGLGPRDGRMITISTAGEDELSPLGLMRDHAYELEEQRREGAYRYCRSVNGEFVMHEWALDSGDDLDDIALVKTANPLSNQTVAKLAARHDSPSTTPGQWARFACNVWMRGDDAIIQPHEWDRLADPASVIPAGADIYVGLDLSWRGTGADTTAIVPVFFESTSRRIIGQVTVLHAPEGGRLDDREVKRALLDLASRYRVRGVVFDPWSADTLAQQMERDEGLTFVEHKQSPAVRAVADGRFLEAVRQGTIVHDGDRVLRSHVLNAVAKTVNGDAFMFDRRPHGPRKPTDALVAASMAHSVAFAESSRSRGGYAFF